MPDTAFTLTREAGSVPYRAVFMVSGVASIVVSVLCHLATISGTPVWVSAPALGVLTASFLVLWLRRLKRVLSTEWHDARPAGGESFHAMGHELMGMESYNDVLRRHLDRVSEGTEAATLELIQRLAAVQGESASLKGSVSASIERAQALAERAHAHIEANRDTLERLTRFRAAAVKALEQEEDRLAAIAQRVRELNPMVNLITEIAKRTNLLALNAAIEAARAGDYGRGFAVVADEVRKLSRQTEEAVDRVSNGINGFASLIESDIRSMTRDFEQINDTLDADSTIHHMTGVSAQFDQMLTFLEGLASELEQSSERVVNDVTEALASMQYQDIARQQLEVIGIGLDHLSEFCQQVGETVTSGDVLSAPPSLRNRLEDLESRYVMLAQRADHDDVLNRMVSEAEGPRIDLF